MTSYLALAVGLTFIIHLISTLSYSVRIVGVRTRRIALSFALFNILILFSRTANTFQAPLLAKGLEQDLLSHRVRAAEGEFRWLLVSAAAATLLGAFLIPTFQRLFSKAVEKFSIDRSLSRLLLRAFSPAGLSYLAASVTIPSTQSISRATQGQSVPMKMLILNTLAVAFLTVGVFSSLYAGYLEPSLRTTSGYLSGIVNGVAALLLFIFIDPYLSILTDDVVNGHAAEEFFRRCVVMFVATRLVGTILAQLLLLPGAHLIVTVARWI